MIEFYPGNIVDGRYRVIRPIGAGGMGKVYLVHHELLDAPRALKVINPPDDTWQSAENWLARFYLEARICELLKHPNIITVHDIAKDDGCAFIVMEYFAAETMLSWSRSVLRPVEQVLHVTKQVALALDYAHNFDPQVLHRDVKPGNILVDEHANAKLIDFGLAKATGQEQLTQTAASLGTLDYLAPEYVNADPAGDDHAHTPLTELWALGCVLYTCLLQRPMYGYPSSRTQRISNAVKADYVPIDEVRFDLTAPVVELVHGLLKHDPSKRIGSAREVIERIEAIDHPTLPGVDPGLVPLLPPQKLASASTQLGRKSARRGAPPIGEQSIALSSSDLLGASSAKIDEGESIIISTSEADRDLAALNEGIASQLEGNLVEHLIPPGSRVARFPSAPGPSDSASANPFTRAVAESHPPSSSSAPLAFSDGELPTAFQPPPSQPPPSSHQAPQPSEEQTAFGRALELREQPSRVVPAPVPASHSGSSFEAASAGTSSVEQDVETPAAQFLPPPKLQRPPVDKRRQALAGLLLPLGMAAGVFLLIGFATTFLSFDRAAPDVTADEAAQRAARAADKLEQERLRRPATANAFNPDPVPVLPVEPAGDVPPPKVRPQARKKRRRSGRRRSSEQPVNKAVVEEEQPARPPSPYDRYGNRDIDNTSMIPSKKSVAAKPKADHPAAAGTKMAARADGLIASHPANSPVIGKLTQPATLGPHELPKGSTVHGRTAGVSGSRVLVNFTYAKTPWGKKISFKGTAMSRDGRAGIPGKKTLGNITDVAAGSLSSALQAAGDKAAEQVGDNPAGAALRGGSTPAAGKADRLNTAEQIVEVRRWQHFTVYVESL